MKTIQRRAAAFAEEFYTLHRTLFGQYSAMDSTVIQFCSSHYSEGVTSTTLSFAQALAGTCAPDSVIAVEANWRRPSFNKILQIKTEQSLAAVLRNEISLLDAVIKPKGLDISVIPAGPKPVQGERSPLDPLLRKLGETFRELKNNYELILVDSPPIIPFIDGSIIAGEVDKVVFVIEARTTRSEVVNRAIDKLKMGGAEISGIILNKRQFYIPRWLYRFI